MCVLGPGIDRKWSSPLSQGSRGSKVSMLIEWWTCQPCSLPPKPNWHARRVLGQGINQKRLSPHPKGAVARKQACSLKVGCINHIQHPQPQQTRQACFRTGDKPKVVIPPIPREQQLESDHACWELDPVGIQQTCNVCFRTGDKPKVVISPVPKEQRLESEHARGPGKVQ